MRYLLELSYRGTAFCGWQLQVGAPTVQGTLEDALATILVQSLRVHGCGRTDTGVHAKTFYAHFDCPQTISDDLTDRLNRLLPPDIAIASIRQVDEGFHARFDAYLREYQYFISRQKDAFASGLEYHLHGFDTLDFDLMQQAAALLTDYQSFKPFCKTHSGVDHYRCTVKASLWSTYERGMVYHIEANRFLRGMVRLIVGMCIRVGQGRLAIDEVRYCLEHQSELPQSWSVPACGLFLTAVHYPP